MYYKIRNTLEEITIDEIFDGNDCYIAVISPTEWIANKEKFNMGIDLEKMMFLRLRLMKGA